MNNELVKKIVELTDKLHELQNILEYADENGIDVRDAIESQIADLYEEIEKLEG